MSAKRYSYRVSWSQEDEAFVGTVAEFPGLSFVGDSQTEALHGIVSTVEDALAILSEEGRTPPVPFGERRYSGHLSLRIAPEQHQRIAIEAAEAHVSVNKLIASRI